MPSAAEDARGIVCCACAGNTAQRHWSGSSRVDADGWHEWRAGQRDNGITPWSDEGPRVGGNVLGRAGANYRLIVVDSVSGAEIGRAEGPATGGNQCAVVRFAPQWDARYAVRVQPIGSSIGQFHLAVLGGWLENYSERGSICFPADGPEFLAIGAWDESGHRASYSSCGPNSPRQKPDFVATVPVPDPSTIAHVFGHLGRFAPGGGYRGADLLPAPGLDRQSGAGRHCRAPRLTWLPRASIRKRDTDCSGCRRSETEPPVNRLLTNRVLSTIPAHWGGSSAGRALHSHCRGREFKSLPLHISGIRDRESEVERS